MLRLFRDQALSQQADRLHGDVLLHPKMSHLFILGFLLLWLCAVVYWLAGSTYARKETVLGWLEPSVGVLRVYAESAGIIKHVLVQEGDLVEKDQPLVVVNGDRILADGVHLEALLLEEYEVQRQRLNQQIERTQNIYLSKVKDIERRVAAAQEDLVLLDQQISTLDKRYDLISGQVVRFRQLHLSGHVSLEDLNTVLERELELRSESQALLRNKVNQRNRVEQLEIEQQLSPDEHANSLNQLNSRMSDIARQMAQLHGQRAYVIKAARDGRVSNLQAREGQKAQRSSPLLHIVPQSVVLSARLLVPVRSIGFVEAGQSLNIRFDAFPYQKFGLYGGEITQVSNSVLLPDDLLNTTIPVREPVYRVSATLTTNSVHAYGRDFALKSGMTLSADVQLGDRTLIQWLLEPIYSLKGRL